MHAPNKQAMILGGEIGIVVKMKLTLFLPLSIRKKKSQAQAILMLKLLTLAQGNSFFLREVSLIN